MNDYYAQIEVQAKARPLEEVCGLLLFDYRGSLQAVPCANVAANPRQDFEISCSDQLKARQTQRLAAYYHSHPAGDETFTAQDRFYSEQAKLPVFVFSLVTNKFNLYRPEATVPALTGRQFVLGFQDCATVVTDYFQLHRKQFLAYFPRSRDMLRHGFIGLDDYLIRHGFTRSEPVPGAVLAFAVNGGTVVNHVGVLLDEDVFAHQQVGDLSEITKFTPEWRRCLVSAWQKL